MVNSWQTLHGGRSLTVVVVLISCRWLKYIYFIVQFEVQFAMLLLHSGISILDVWSY